MNQNATNILYNEAQNDIAAIIRIASAISDEFVNMERSVNQATSESVFVGAASESLKEQFRATKVKLNSFLEMLDMYAKKLNISKNDTQDLERMLANLAADIQ